MELKKLEHSVVKCSSFLYLFFLCDLMGRRRRHGLVMLHGIKVVLIHQGGLAVLEDGRILAGFREAQWAEALL